LPGRVIWIAAALLPLSRFLAGVYVLRAAMIRGLRHKPLGRRSVAVSGPFKELSQVPSLRKLCHQGGF